MLRSSGLHHAVANELEVHVNPSAEEKTIEEKTSAENEHLRQVLTTIDSHIQTQRQLHTTCTLIEDRFVDLLTQRYNIYNNAFIVTCVCTDENPSLNKAKA